MFFFFCMIMNILLKFLFGLIQMIGSTCPIKARRLTQQTIL